MRYFLKAARFFYHVRSNRANGVNVCKMSLPAGDGQEGADVYAPGTGSPRCPGTILLVHGMAASGNKDPRIIALARALARCGFIVVTPLFTDISGFRIRHQTPADIARVIDAVARDPKWCPAGKLSVFSTSFSAGMSLIAAARADVAHRVSAVCVVGSYCRVASAIEQLMARRDDDDYGRLIVLRNFLPYRNGWNKQVDDALCAAILDNGLERESPEFPRHMGALSDAEKSELTRLLSDAEYRVDWWRRLIDESSDVREICRRLSVLPQMSHLRASVAILHGAGDRVIPREESVALYRHLKSLPIRSRLSITRLISHGDVLPGLSLIWDMAGVLRTLALFFRCGAVTSRGCAATDMALFPASGDGPINPQACRVGRISNSSPTGPGPGCS